MLTHSQGPPAPGSATHLEHPCPQLQPQQASHSPLDADGVGVLCAAAWRAVRGVDGDRETTFAMSRGWDGYEGDCVGQVGAGGIRQDLLNDGGHHSLVVAVSAARATGSGDPKSGKKSVSGQ